MSWLIRYATEADQDRWFTLASNLKSDFCGLDLGNDERFRNGMIKNIKRNTAIYVEETEQSNPKIIEAMTYSRSSNHISWLGVQPDYRRKGIASALMNHMLSVMDANEIKVTTFLYDDACGTAARAFYVNHGFIGGEINMEVERFPHTTQEFIRKKS